MSDLTKINSTHLSRLAYVYLRQSSAAQVEHNRESTARQYALVAKAAELGWPPQQVLVIDEDLGVSGSGNVERSGFARLIAEVALGHVGIVLGLEGSRLARNNADWYRAVRPDRHSDRRRRWDLPPRTVQRQAGARSQRHNERSRVAHLAGSLA